mmetsp:Transcript_57467/g.125892  ORF Transcript_57467/g.125892 Transcript_57467/m.125892 type:complete len:509 (+) Transcript_57467:803-2329(+)
MWIYFQEQHQQQQQLQQQQQALQPTQPPNMHLPLHTIQRNGGPTGAVGAGPSLGCSPGASSVLAAALADAAGGGTSGLGGVPLASVEECVLRLLVLQRELNSSEEAGRQELAAAAAGLAPRMLQVLQAAKNLCVSNRNKLKAFCQEKDLDLNALGGGGATYLEPQIQALDKLTGQYASLLGGSRNGAGEADQNQAPTSHLGASWGGPQSVAHGGPHSVEDRLHHSGVGYVRDLQGGTASGLVGASFLSEAPSSARRPASPLDPGAAGPQLPMLRSGGSTPPPAAKFRQGQPAGPIPRSYGSVSAVDPHSARGSARGSPLSWDPFLASAAHSTRLAQPPRAYAAASASRFSPALVDPGMSSTGSSPRRYDYRPTYSPSSGGAGHQMPLRAALQQLRGVTDDLRPPRSLSRGRQQEIPPPTPGGAHAGAGSPSPEGRTRTGRSASRPREDKYLKILQSLQAKGASGAGLAAQLLQSASNKRGSTLGSERGRGRGAARRLPVSDSESSDSD